ncbi:MAG: hypothetical protein WBN71_13995 [Acidimicrobiia bacterium]|jgi:hypothetical protein
MIETTPTLAMTDTELEDWFSEAGLSATVVERCPVVACPSCAQRSNDGLADAA